MNVREVTVFLVFVCPTIVTAATVVDQPPIDIGNPHDGVSGVASAVADKIFTKSQAYDNFVISQPIEINQIQWTGSYFRPFSAETPRVNTAFQVQIIPDASNRPDVTAPFIADLLLDAGTAGIDDGTDVRTFVVPDQLSRGSGNIVRYEADLAPFLMDPGTYWMSIQAVQTLPEDLDFDHPEWLWGISTAGDKFLYSYDELFDPIDTQPGVPVSSFDAAFSLFGELTAIAGDFDFNGLLEAADIDLLSAAVRAESTDSLYDVNQDGEVSAADHQFWIDNLKGVLAGDVDMNGDVGFTDFLQLASDFGAVGGWGDGNFDTNDVVDFVDFLALATNFGQPPPDLTAASVPEPVGMATALVACFSLTVMRRRRGQV